VRYALIPALRQTPKHAANASVRSFPPMRVREAIISVKLTWCDETEISVSLPLALAIFDRSIAPTLRPKARDWLPLGRKRMRRGDRVVDCTALEICPCLVVVAVFPFEFLRKDRERSVV
jgi:hypothetical protein